MNAKKLLPLALGGALLAGCLTGCGTATASPSPLTFPSGAPLSQPSDTPAVFAEDMEPPQSADTGLSSAESFKPYEPFGLTYDAGTNELRYHGKLVRWFEDYYPLPDDGTQAGLDFFNENGTVDVYAVRDLSRPVRSEDGSYDPGGRLTDVKAFSEEEFAARDIEALKNPPPALAIAGDPPSAEELASIAEEYAPFGVTYNAEEAQWYFQGQPVRFFQDVLTSNGESLTNGKFHGTLRTFWGENGTVDIRTVRDFAKANSSGNGTLTGIEPFSQEE